MPQRKENAFIVRHYAGRVKYQVIYFLFNCTYYFCNRKLMIYLQTNALCLY